ncbi:hypothetical protein TRFO_15198 [Tritrichomonas foetus]|uniref:SH3 domain-containing protein n=1 Tax=Tritrichomonas foetus TaxID=1144522 RepID=A0A1J4KT38_9EUKA|nr:hypothetical protein TRFO_15198 [Tritrichomonas foetus]|eukprot:OHT14419.1 hypothetical protein TRFO_15198 [Tritrichomonas foetus]
MISVFHKKLSTMDIEIGILKFCSMIISSLFSSNQTPTTDNPFTPVFDDLRKTSQARCAFCDEIQKNLLIYSTNFQTYAEKLFQISAEATGNLKKKTRPEELEQMTNWVISNSSNYQNVDQFSKMVKMNIIAPLYDLSKNYAKQTEAQFLVYQQLAKKYEQDEKQYQDVYQKYIKHCQLIESTGQKCDKNPSKYQAELNSLRDRCIAFERDTAAACDAFAKLSSQYQSAVEQIILTFESIERSFFDSFAEIMRKLAGLIDQLENSYVQLSETSKAELNTIHQNNEKTGLQNKIDESSSIIDQFSHVGIPNFNIFDVLPPHVVFQADLTANYLNVQQSYSVKTLSLNAGDLVKAVSERPTTIRVEAPNGIRGKVPRSLLKPNKTYKPVIYQVKMAHTSNGSDLNLEPGTFVLGLTSSGQSAMCRDILGRVGQVPLSKLQLYDPPK